MSSSNRNQRGRNAGGGGQQQRRRGRSPQQGGGGQGRPQAPKGPMMTALGESTYEAVFDHGNEGYGIWFDGMVRDDPMYKQFWKGLGLRSIYVKLEEDRIVIVRDLDREIPIVAAGASSETSSTDEVDIAAAVAKADDVTYTAEEAARLFVSASETEAAETPDGKTDSSAPAADADVAAPGVEDTTASAEQTADAPEGEAGSADEEPKKPAVRRRVTARRTTVKRTPRDADESQPAGDE